LTESTWLRMTRAVDAQLVIPMTTTITMSVTRIPRLVHRADDARIGARTGQDECQRDEQVDDAHRDGVRRPPAGIIRSGRLG
jgi:hypothetical protein